MPKPAFKEREKQRREEEILAEAGRLISASGYADLNMEQLAEEVGISKPTLYQHFKSKDDLIAHVLIRGLEELHTHLHSTTQSSPLERLTAAMRMLLDKRYASDGVLAGVGPEIIAFTVHSHKGVLAARAATLRLLETVVEAGKQRGEIASDIPPELVSGLLFSLMGVLASSGRDFSNASDGERREAIEQVVRLFVRAIAI